MIYKIEFTKSALKFLKKQPKNQSIRLLSAINKLPSGDIKKLKGDNELSIESRGLQGNLYN